MKINHSVRPEDILPDGVETTSFNGMIVRKGTIAAFVANADILENPNANEQQKQLALATMKELAPALIATGLHKHAIFKNAQVEQLLVEAEITSMPYTPSQANK